MRNYELSQHALLDLEEIVSYLNRENPQAANEFVDAAFLAMDDLAQNPLLGHVREDLTNRPVRFWTFKWHYLIIYTEQPPINIVRVLSGYRDIVNLMA
jgi:plasmid stabilization system protein ParE